MAASSPYLELADELERSIARLSPGARVPSEHELAKRHGLHRLTTRAALTELERRDLVRRVKGRGTFVARRIDYRLGPDGPPSFTETIHRAGAVPRTETAHLRLQRASAAVREQLGLAAGAQVWSLGRRRFVDEELVGWAESLLPAELVPDLRDRLPDGASLYAVLRDAYAIRSVRSFYRAEVAVASAAIAERLGLAGRPAVIAVDARNHRREDRRPVEVSRGWLSAKVFRIVVEFDGR